jgi:hypothetical protein
VAERNWSWLDAFKKGDDHAFSKQLEAEAERSLNRDPGRWSTPHVDETPSHTPHPQGGRDAYTDDYDRRHAGRKNQGGKGERNEPSARQYRIWRRDYERQQRGHLGPDEREIQRAQERHQARLEREQAQRELRDAERQARDDYRQGRPPPPFRSW